MIALDWLNQNSSAITAIATTVLAIITGIYAWLTSRLASGSNKTNEKLQTLSEALDKSAEQQAQVIKVLQEGQVLQNEANLMKYYEIMGNTKINNKVGFDKAFPAHDAKWRQHKDRPKST